MAAYHVKLDLPTYWMEMAKFLVAAFIVRGSACTINDIFDRKFDAGVGELDLVYLKLNFY
jgi:4-hydroxybenzoate polyprenyltransferase